MPITSLSSAQGFQSFLDAASNIMVATATVGSPAAGQFYSSISGRSSMIDLSKDMKPRMGIERIMTQQVQLSQTEFGPNGEPVWTVLNDTFGQIRYVGTWSNNNAGSGQYIANASTSVDYVEVTFYGTGLNVLIYQDSGTRPMVAAVDGGAAGSNFVPASTSGVLSGQRYSENVVLNAVTGLALGVHTVKISGNGTNTPVAITGFEVLNESSSVKVNPGFGYINGQKLTLASQSAISYSSVVSGTRGGRTLVYQASDGTIGQAFQAVNGSSVFYPSAVDHSNEEVVRTYQPLEFGAGRPDDFSTLTSSSTNRAFTLDDGTTTLLSSAATINGAQNITLSNNNATFFILYFIGTGLDVEWYADAVAGSDNYTYSIDGATAVAWPTNAAGTSAKRTTKVASGLPYGMHTFKFTRVTAASYQIYMSRFIAYQPKKPSLPAGAIELADYNVMATFVANTTVSQTAISTGVMRKNCIREFVYVEGTGGTSSFTYVVADPSNGTAGAYIFTDRQNASISYTFFGTGFDARMYGLANRSTSISVTLNGLAATTGNFSGLTSSVYGGITFSAGTLNAAGGNPFSGLVISGLPLATYTVKFNNNNASQYLIIDTIDVITPIYSVKSNLYGDTQNTVPVGSNSISDNRVSTPVKDVLPATKAWAQSVGIVANPTSTVNNYVPIPDMSCTIKTNGGPIRIIYNLTTTNSTAAAGVNCLIYVDGVPVGVAKTNQESTASYQLPISDSIKVPVSAGVHKVDVYWTLNGGSTMTALGIQRNLLVEET